jgi:Transcription factor WhiB
MGSMTLPPHWLGPLPLLPSAACKDASDPDAWFSADIGVMLAAQRICATCPERSACLAFAVEQDIRLGVWGGTLPHERGRPARHRATG